MRSVQLKAHQKFYRFGTVVKGLYKSKGELTLSVASPPVDFPLARQLLSFQQKGRSVAPCPPVLLSSSLLLSTPRIKRRGRGYMDRCNQRVPRGDTSLKRRVTVPKDRNFKSILSPSFLLADCIRLFLLTPTYLKRLFNIFPRA